MYKLNQVQKYTLHVNPGFDAAGCVTSGLPIDEAHFPAEGFRKLVGDRWHDLNGNGCLSDSEVNAITSLSGGYSGTWSLAGVEYLPNVSYIDLKNVGLEEIDLSANPLVNSLYLRNNNLTSVDVSMLDELRFLDVSGNPGLSTLTLGGGILEALNCYACPLIRSLDLSTQPHLLKAYLDGGSYEGEYEGLPYVSYGWVSEDESMTGSLWVDADIDIAAPVWDWIGMESACFILPNGTVHAAAVTSEISADGKSITCTAGVTLNGVPFTASRTFRRITFSGADIPDQSLSCGDCVTRPEDPIRIGSIFGGWYTDEACLEEYSFSAPVSEGFTIFARWMTPSPDSFLALPSGITIVGSEAFAGVSARTVIVPKSISGIADDAFDLSHVEYIYGYAGTFAEAFADACGFSFVPIDDAWLASH